MNKDVTDLRIAFAGDRDIAFWVLKFIISQDIFPLALLVPESDKASHSEQLISLCPFLSQTNIITGREFRQTEGVKKLKALKLDYIICIHFPYIIPPEVLNIPEIGILNLHPAYLPYNKGWHTPTWSILENTPAGATLHFMEKEVDAGDIIHQKQLDILPGDTANSLYKRLKLLELETFKEAWPAIKSGTYQRQPQNFSNGTCHKRQELFHPAIQEINLSEFIKAYDLISKLRALTTNRIDEAAYYVVNGKRYRVQISIYEDTD